MTTRRLAAILAADVVGFSSMMEKDEEGTLAKVKALQREVIEPRVKERGGRLVKTTGDGFLCEFGSPVEAVRCAVEVQEATTANGGSDLLLRMGINLGDIIVEPDGDIYGEGVNVAARLEQMAEPGSICVSGAIHEQVEGKVPVTFEGRGEQQVKNIARPVRVYALAGTALSVREPKGFPSSDKPSIAVLPFTNLSGDPEQEYFADGVVEELITNLSRFKSFLVIARNSSFTYKGRGVDVEQVSRELGVRYVLEGSLRKAANRIRITAQLIEVETGVHVWADRYDALLDDLFTVQDELSSSVVGALTPQLEKAEIARVKRKRSTNLNAYDLFLRGLSVVHTHTAEGVAEALCLFNASSAADPEFAVAYGGAAMCYSIRKAHNWLSSPPDDDIRKATQLGRRAIELGADDGVALCYGGHALAFVGRDLQVGSRAAERAVALNPNLAAALSTSAFINIWDGSTDIALERLHRAVRLSPLDFLMPWMHASIAHAHFHAERYEEAVSWAMKSVAARDDIDGMRVLAAALGQLGRNDQARVAIEKLQKVDPILRVSSLERVLGPYRAERLERYRAGLRMAGLPE